MEPGPAVVTVSGQVLARNTALNLLGRLLPMLVALVTMPYVVRRLGPDRFGLLSLAWLMLGYFTLFDLGMGPATTKYVAEALGKGETDRLPELVWTAVGTQSCFGLAAGTILALAAPLLTDRLFNIPAHLRPEAHAIFLILAVVLPVEFTSGSMRGVLAASQRFDLLNALTIPASSLNYLLPAVALALGSGLPAIVLFLVVTRVVTLGVLFILCRHLYPALRAKFRFDRHLVRPLLGFGGWVTVSGIVGPFLDYFDRFLIAAVISVAAVGFYTPPYMISTRLIVLPQSLAIALFPAFSTLAGCGDAAQTRKLFIDSFKFLILLMGPCVLLLAFFARPLLTLWLGADFAKEGALPLQILAVGIFFNALAYVPYNLLYGLGRPDLNAKFHLAELPVHILLLWLLVSRLRLPGAALAWVVRASLDFLLLIVAACRIMHISPRVLASSGLRRSVGALVALAAGLAVVWNSAHSLTTQTITVLFLGGGFLLVTWRYVLNWEEKCQIKFWLKLMRWERVRPEA